MVWEKSLGANIQKSWYLCAMQTAQRVSKNDPSDGYVLARSVVAYDQAALRIGQVPGARVLEVGTGSGYGVGILAPVCQSLTTVDKCAGAGVVGGPAGFGSGGGPENVEFRRAKVPPLDFPSCSFDFVVALQVIEHLKDDFGFVAEVARVLRPGGKFIVSTPNRPRSLTRNPWHVREYTAGEFWSLIASGLDGVEAFGVFGNERVEEYYERNRASVARFGRLDPLRLREWAPRWILRVPYDVANRLNRRQLASGGPEIVADDYFLRSLGAGAGGGTAGSDDDAYDLFYVGTKK